MCNIFSQEACPASPDGVRLRQHHYSDREPWSCLDARREGDYDIHWELRDTSVSNGKTSPSSPTRPSCPSSFSTAPDSTIALETGAEEKSENNLKNAEGETDEVELEEGEGGSGSRVSESPAAGLAAAATSAEGGSKKSHSGGGGSSACNGLALEVDPEGDVERVNLDGRGGPSPRACGSPAAVAAAEVGSKRSCGSSACSGPVRAVPDERAVWVLQRLRVSGTHNLVDLAADDADAGASLLAEEGWGTAAGGLAEGDTRSSRTQPILPSASPKKKKKSRARMTTGGSLHRFQWLTSASPKNCHIEKKLRASPI